MATPTTIRKRRRRNRREGPFLIHYWPIIAVLIAIAAFFIYRFATAKPPVSHVVGYAADVDVLRQQYEHAMTKSLDSAYRKSFERATEFADRGEYEQALALLEPAAKKTPLPIVLNDMGILYDRRKDFARGIRCFRQAITLDEGYAQAYSNLELVTANLGGGLPTEVEPNNAVRFADLVSLDRPVQGEIETAVDRDYFYFVVPPQPRDRFEIALANRSSALKPSLQIYDDTGTVQTASVVQGVGDSLDYAFGPLPGSKVYVAVVGQNDTLGGYSLTVKAKKSFDQFEPNDDMASAKRVNVGEHIQANIMDADDNDFYSFLGPRSGSVTIELQASKSLAAALTTFTSDWKTSGISPPADASGKIHYTVPVEQHVTYYLEVRPLGNTAGNYTLTIQ